MADWRTQVSEDNGTGEVVPTPSAGPGSWRDQAQLKGISDSTVEAKVGTFGQGATGGAIEGGATLGGIVTGAQLGATVGAFGGPAAPVTVPLGAGIGAIAGGVAGYLAGKSLRHYAAQVKIPWSDTQLTFEDTSSVPKNLRPYAVAGETFGSISAFSTAPYVAAANGFRFAPNLSGRFFNRVIETAAEHPTSFMLSEIAAASGSSAGAGIAENIAPGSVGARLSGEIIGGVVNPARLPIAAYRYGAQKFTNVVSTFTPTGRMNKSAAMLQRIVSEAGDDPKAIAALIRQRSAEFPELKLTAGQMSENPALLSLEAEIASHSAKFGQASKDAAQTSLESLRTMISALDSVGSPDALRAAAQMRQDYFHTLIASKLKIAEDKSLEAAAMIAPENPASRADFGRQVSTIMDEAMAGVRATEKELWGKVNKDVPTATHTIRARLDELRASRLPEEPLPAIVEGFATRTAGQQTTSGEVMIFRSRMLALARESAAKNEWSDARIYGELAEAAVDDLTVGVSIMPAGTAAAYDAARSWSKQLNLTFGQSFAGKSLAVGTAGQNRIPPELLMQRAFGAGKEVGELQLRQLDEAAKMAGPEYVSRLVDLQERTIRFMAADVLDANGKVRPDRMARFTRNNAELLNRFPELKAQLVSAEKAERFLQATRSDMTRAAKTIETESAFARILGGQDPSYAVGKALISATPEKDFLALAQLAQRGGQQAKDGLKSSILSYAYQRAGGDADFSFAAYRQIFEGPLAKTQGVRGLTLSGLMEKAGLFTQKEHQAVLNYVRRAEGIEAALASRAPLHDALKNDDAMFEFVLRIAGANLGKLAPTGGAHPLIVAGAGSKAARQIFDKIPNSRVRDIMAEAMLNPEFTAALLERHVSQPARIRMALQMNAYLWNAGITTWPPDAERDRYMKQGNEIPKTPSLDRKVVPQSNTLGNIKGGPKPPPPSLNGPKVPGSSGVRG